jgi:hypothetical protein
MRNNNLLVDASKFIDLTIGNICAVEFKSKDLERMGYKPIIQRVISERHEMNETYCIMLEIEKVNDRYSFVNEFKNQDNIANFEKGLNKLKL